MNNRSTFMCRILLAAPAILWLGFGFGHPAIAEIVRPTLTPAPFKSPKIGARMVFEDLTSGLTEEGLFARSEGMLIHFTWEGRKALALTPFCPDCAAGLPADGGPLAALYPLQVGKGIRFTRKTGGRTWNDDILITTTERITVPAGTFDSFVVRRRSELVGSDWWAEQRSWYAPELGWLVKFEGKTSDGKIEAWQLIEWRP